MTCEQAIPQAELLPLGLLEPGERAALEAHLDGCAACRAASQALGAAWGAHLDEVERVTGEPIGAAARERALVAAVAAAERAAEEGDMGSATKKPVAPGPAIDQERVEAVGRKIALGCSYCHARAAREEVVFCAACLAPHHEECFRAHGRCSLPGCGERETVRPGRVEAAPPTRRRRGAVISILFAAAASGGLAALTVNRRHAADQARQEARLNEELAQRAREIARLTERMGERPAATRVSLEVEGATLQDVAEQIGRQAGVNVLVEPGVQEKVTVALRDIPWEEGLEVLARITHCRLERRGGVILFTQPPRVTIQFTGANVRTVLQLLAAYSGKNIVLGPEVTGDLTLDIKDLDWEAALLTIAHGAGTKAWRVTEDLLYVGHEGPPGSTRLEPRSDPRPASGGAGAAGPLVSLGLLDQGVREACAALARRAGRAIHVEGEPAQGRRISLDVREAPWEAVLTLIAQRADCDVQLIPGGAVVTPIRRVELSAADAPLGAALALVGALADLQVVVPGDLAARRLTLSLAGARPLEAFTATASSAGCQVIEEGGALRVQAGPEPRPEAPAPGDRRLEAIGRLGAQAGIVLGGQIYRIDAPLVTRDGDQVEGSAVLAIEADRVHLRLAGGREVALALGEALPD